MAIVILDPEGVQNPKQRRPSSFWISDILTMSPLLDQLLVLLAIGLALTYLIWRKLRSRRRSARDWSSGHNEVCTSCPIVKIHDARREQLKAGN
jgi:hypothetical protein